jgi:hypothetical protein
MRAITVGLYGILFFGTIHAIWFGHHKAFIAGGMNKNDFMQGMYHKFFKSMQFIHEKYREEGLMMQASV